MHDVKLVLLRPLPLRRQNILRTLRVAFGQHLHLPDFQPSNGAVVVENDLPALVVLVELDDRSLLPI